ncbi:MAG: pilus (MSHA type) biogenesis protein MshL [Gammaproteobacteria bacterium RIFOXYA12_FULL_61_12]|nr:MAG: pilus (MSHA type) biogenesis protein MshL [Gammaproteobacteria bacterium RIFOXYD12_FULL_61_37]OGT92049.1 MAG: pilus (MSHA type) biogenesis protein MshL [Gammaproteobacteria bacterium RIFOXYA12_FULL_61_12]
MSLLIVLAAGCKSHEERSDTTTLADIKQELAEGNKAAPTPGGPPPAEVSAALMPQIKIDLGADHVVQDERFDVNINDAPARAFLMGLVEGTSYNMVVHPDVTGAITLNLKAVTVPEVMEVLREVYGYEYDQSRTGFNVMPARLQSRIFEIDYLNIRRSGNSQTRVSSGQITETSVGKGTDPATGKSSTEERASGTQILTQSDSDFWGELKSSLTSIIGAGEGRSVVVSAQSGVVVVRAMPTELREVAEYLKVTQNNLQRQVVIEAKVVEVRLNNGSQSGVNWAGLIEKNGKTMTLGQVGGGSVFSDANGLSSIAGNTGDLNPAAYAPVTATAVDAFGGVFSAALKLGDFAAFIELLKTQGNVQVLSSPRISTVNNQKAVIKVGTDEFFVTDVSSTTVTGTATTTSPDVTLTPFFSGIALDVIPRVTKEGDVILHVHPAVSEVTDQTKVIEVAGQTQSLPLALSTVRESDSVVKATSGQLVVIGGLMQNRSTVETSGLPGISDTPVLGSLFRHTRDKTSKSELVILLRPIVVDSPATFQEQQQQSLDRIRTLSGR